MKVVVDSVNRKMTICHLRFFLICINIKSSTFVVRVDPLYLGQSPNLTSYSFPIKRCNDVLDGSTQIPRFIEETYKSKYYPPSCACICAGSTRGNHVANLSLAREFIIVPSNLRCQRPSLASPCTRFSEKDRVKCYFGQSNLG